MWVLGKMTIIRRCTREQGIFLLQSRLARNKSIRFQVCAWRLCEVGRTSYYRPTRSLALHQGQNAFRNSVRGRPLRSQCIWQPLNVASRAISTPIFDCNKTFTPIWTKFDIPSIVTYLCGALSTSTVSVQFELCSVPGNRSIFSNSGIAPVIFSR